MPSNYLKSQQSESILLVLLAQNTELQQTEENVKLFSQIPLTYGSDTTGEVNWHK